MIQEQQFKLGCDSGKLGEDLRYVVQQAADTFLHTTQQQSDTVEFQGSNLCERQDCSSPHLSFINTLIQKACVTRGVTKLPTEVNRTLCSRIKRKAVVDNCKRENVSSNRHKKY